MVVVNTMAKPVDMAQIKKYGLKSKYTLQIVPIIIAHNIPKVAIIEVLANNQLHWFLGADSITSKCVTGFFPTKKNPIIGEIIKSMVRFLVKYNQIQQSIIKKNETRRTARLT